MCDYSLEAVKSRAAVKGDKLVSHNFLTGSRGFKSVDDQECGQSATAICLLPGTELVFDTEIVKHQSIWIAGYEIAHKTAIFRHRNQGVDRIHHDTLEFPEAPDGLQIYLSDLEPGQTATVIQVPTTSDERHEQRLEKALDGIDIKAPEYTD